MNDSIRKELERLSAQLRNDGLTPDERLEVSSQMLDLVSQLPGGEEVVRRLAAHMLPEVEAVLDALLLEILRSNPN